MPEDTQTPTESATPTADDCYNKLNEMVQLLQKIASVLGVK
ncbi:hypothetical protein [Arcobacter ellisii]|jgi:hypothetical protein|nr:hypothetical protein [Arcobacter ellisii]